MPTQTKLASHLKKGDTITINGRAFEVTDARKHRRYAGYIAVQYKDGEAIRQADLRAGDSVMASYP